MSENLIYGADITAYGAVGDGKTDCTEAFIKAIENGESLISVPFGTYLITSPLEISSNTKLHIHPSAVINFIPKDKKQKSFIYAKEKACIEITGGRFIIENKVKCSVFSFCGCENVRINSCNVISADALCCIELDGTSDVCISNVVFNGKSDGVVLTGKCENITVKNCTATAAVNVIGCGFSSKACDVSNFTIRNIKADYCDSFIEFLNGCAKDVLIENIHARFTFDFAKLFDKFSLSDTVFEELKLFCVYRNLNDGKARTYFALASCPDGLEIRNFKRLCELEAMPLIPSFIIRNTNADKAKMIIDGIALDNVISARGKSKTVSMTTAKLANPCGKFIYTLEIGVEKDDTFTLPFGDFDYLRIDRA